MSEACIVGQISVKDPIKWAEYRSLVPATLLPWGGELVLRGTLAAVLSGAQAHTDIVVIRFANLAALKAWHASAAYQALIPLRQQAAEVDLLAYEI